MGFVRACSLTKLAAPRCLSYQFDYLSTRTMAQITVSTMHSTLSLLPILLAQTSGGDGSLGPGFYFLFLVFYVFAAFTCQKIFEKCGVENAWFAWIPILGTYANFQAGDEENPVLWTILSLVPCVNIAAVVKLVIAWVKICQKLGKSPWLLLLVLIPTLGSFILLGYLAFG